jgi:DNA-binding LacI/PurR family transcriptional regulator
MVLPSLVVAGVGQEDVSANARRTARSRYHFFCNDDLAQGALMQASRQGVAAGFNDLGGSDQMLPMLTIARTPSPDWAHHTALAAAVNPRQIGRAQPDRSGTLGW